MKYNVQFGIGRAKYVVNHYDGKKQHPDGSEFWDITIPKTKKKLAQVIKALRLAGYTEGK